MRHFLYIIFLFVYSTSFSQHETDNWFFGANLGLTFSTNPPSFLPVSAINTQEGCASISDAAGNLLFYSDGVSVWDKTHSLMPNGTGLFGHSSSTQSCLFVPMPGSSTLYYIFTSPVMGTQNPFAYSIIDLTLNNGNGDVTAKNVPLFSSATEKLTAVKKSNGIDVWIIGHAFNSADFYVFELTSTGVNPTPVISTAGSAHTGTIDNAIGVMKVSPCGNKIALNVMYDAFTELFDFDNSTGIVSNAVHLGNYAFANTWGLYGLEFSPDCSRLYITQENPALLVQYNLLAGSTPAIIASADTIIMYPMEFFGTLQNAPDGKIYITRFSNLNPKNYLSSIDQPNNPGTSCSFIDSALGYPSGHANHGLPNFMVSYFNTTTGWEDDYTISGNNFVIYPNPFDEEINIYTSIPSHNLAQSSPNSALLSVTVYDVFGKEVLKYTCPNATCQLQTTNLSSGIYFTTIVSGGKSITKKVVKQNSTW